MATQDSSSYLVPVDMLAEDVVASHRRGWNRHEAGYDEALASHAIRAARMGATAQAASDPVAQDAKTLASWLLADPEGEPLMIAGPIEPGLLGYGIVRLCDKNGNEWTLKARLSEGYRSAAKELANVHDAIRTELGEQA